METLSLSSAFPPLFLDGMFLSVFLSVFLSGCL